MTPAPEAIAVEAADGHRWELIATLPQAPRAALLWLPAMGMPARHYQPLANVLAARGIAVYLHEWRGIGSSNLRAGRESDWGYREILTLDLPRSQAAMGHHANGATPLAIGGHSLGAQFGACLAALHPGAFQHLWLVASGSPHWRAFPSPLRHVLPPLFRFLPWLAQRRGLLRGRRLGFAGNEARTLISDWARVGLSGRYAAEGLEHDLDAALTQVTAQVQAVLLADDWFAPRGSMQALLDKMPAASVAVRTLDAVALGARADHFAWMRHPHAVAERLVSGLAPGGTATSPADILRGHG